MNLRTDIVGELRNINGKGKGVEGGLDRRGDVALTNDDEDEDVEELEREEMDVD